jgi:hypothetical protein
MSIFQKRRDDKGLTIGVVKTTRCEASHHDLNPSDGTVTCPKFEIEKAEHPPPFAQKKLRLNRWKIIFSFKLTKKR